MPRLIDADALIARWKAALLHMSKDKSGLHPIGLETAIEDVKARPTIDPSTLRPKGEWLERRLDNFRMLEAKCSECGWTGIENYDAYVDPFDFNFCPNCGADMRGET